MYTSQHVPMGIYLEITNTETVLILQAWHVYVNISSSGVPWIVRQRSYLVILVSFPVKAPTFLQIVPGDLKFFESERRVKGYSTLNSKAVLHASVYVPYGCPTVSRLRNG